MGGIPKSRLTLRTADAFTGVISVQARRLLQKGERKRYLQLRASIIKYPKVNRSKLKLGPRARLFLGRLHIGSPDNYAPDPFAACR